MKIARVSRSGFTIVELLVVIVVIGILAAITIVAYAGVQQRSRDADRKTDVATITKALELFYTDNGTYPLIIGSGSSTINGSWSTSADSSWTLANSQVHPYYSSLSSALVPKYISKLPRDPTDSQNVDVMTNTAAYNYAYFGNYGSGYCGVGDGKMYMLIWRGETTGVSNQLSGACAAPSVGPYGSGSSTIRVVK
ncbi:MAG: ral secretion pathway protein [Patescibacteria group bacterium]|nr:ral secretion pathway protein [Patescibacteria group bacterium]